MQLKLCTFGEGLFRTHVTWDDIQKNCIEVFGETAVFGPKKKATTVGDGRGFLSKICLVDPDWQTPQKLAPKKFLVKICTQIIGLEMAKQMNLPEDSPFLSEEFMESMAISTRKVHNNEITFYHTIKKYHKEGLAIPEIYYAQKFSEENPIKGYLIMEFIENGENTHLYDNLSVEDVKQPLRSMAILQAASTQFSDEERNAFKVDVMKDIFGKIFNMQNIQEILDMLKSSVGDRLGSKIDKMEKCMPSLLDLEFLNQIPTDLDIPPVLIHGDLWSTNMIWNKTEDGKMKLVAIVDFQTASFGLTAADLCRMLNASLSAKDRKRHENELIDTFYGYLKEEMNGQKMPYTKEQLKESVLRYKPIGSMLLVTSIGPLFQMNSQIADPEQKQKMLDQIVEKTEGLLDDIIYYQERNDQIKKEKANGSKN